VPYAQLWWTMHFSVFAGPYGKALPDGRLELKACNLFFVEPAVR
jgi:hypothetical protein